VIEQIGEKELALTDANKAIESNPMEAMLYRNRALMHGPGQEASASADRAMGECVRAIYLPYELLPQKGWKPTGDPVDGSLSEAVVVCNNAMDSASWVPVFLRGWGHVGQREYDLAVSDYSKAIELSPVNRRAYAYKARGLAQEARGDFEAASLILGNHLSSGLMTTAPKPRSPRFAGEKIASIYPERRNGSRCQFASQPTRALHLPPSRVTRAEYAWGIN
jgi:tetratricopeptide (TPR) repeat protein